MSQLRRYPGVKPFETAEQSLFFGRDRDIQDLHDLVLLEKLVVLFGKSGYGKSSLINAGLIPLLIDEELPSEERMIPLTVRMRSYTEQENSPVKKITEALQSELSKVIAPEAFQKVWAEKGGRNSLWAQFRQRCDGNTPQVVLIFDQFEEFFTYPAAQQAQFRQELAELLYTEIPQSLREDWRNQDRELRRFLSQPLQIKVLFAIRQDKLSLLNGLRDQLPTILQKRYELQGLTQTQARQAIEEPAKLQEGTYASTAFAYEATALQTLIEELSKGQKSDPYAAGQAIRIESFLLQICCEYIESRAIETNDKLIEPQDLPDFANIYEAYYNGKIGELPPSQQAAARKLMEEGLLYYDAQSGDARRLSVDKDQLLLAYQAEGVNDSLLDVLKNKFLIREERNSVGGFSYEISHDTLLPPILKAREIRQQEETRRKIRRRNLRYAGIIGLVGLVAAGAIVLAVWALGQRDEAVLAKEEALRQKVIADSTLIVLETANQQRFEENLRRGQEFMEVSAYDKALVAYQSALAFDSTNVAAKEGISIAEEKSGVQATFAGLMAAGKRQLENNQNLAARRSFREALATGYNNAEAQTQIQKTQALLEGEFNELVKSGDTFSAAANGAEGYLEAARQKYRKALQIREDAEVKRKLDAMK